MFQNIRSLFVLASAVILVTCASGCFRTRVDWKEPSYVPSRIGLFRPIVQLENAEQLYATALQQEELQLDSCVDLFFQVAMATCHDDGGTQGGSNQCCLHKSALTKLVVTGQRFGRLDPRQGLRVCRNGIEEWVPITHSGFVWHPSDFHSLVPVGDYSTNAFRNHHRQPGLGVPLVVVLSGKSKATLLPDRCIFAATIRLARDHQVSHAASTIGSECQLQLFDPLRIDTAPHHGVHQRIAKDISASLAFRLRNENPKFLQSFVGSESLGGESRLYTLEPYQPGKIPVVFVHGLLSDPFTWVEMVNELRATPGFFKHFQLWFFEYPTGRAFLSTAAQLRQKLAAARKVFDPYGQDCQLCNMVLVGHSMGGLVSKLQVTSSGNLLWRSVSNRPLHQLNVSRENRQKLADAFYFEPSPCISRVIYIGTPHRGSALATRLIGRIGSSLASTPDENENEYRNILRNNPGVFSSEMNRRLPSSIDLLEPKSPLLNTIAQLPVNPNVRMHSIIGDQFLTYSLGRSDGVVPLESAHESHAVTERFVNATHGKTKSHPDSIHEVRCILQRHLAKVRQ